MMRCISAAIRELEDKAVGYLTAANDATVMCADIRLSVNKAQNKPDDDCRTL